MGSSNHDRSSDRQAVLKTAKLIFKGSVVDCLLRDQSATGFRVELGAPVPIPDEVVVQFSGGAAYRAVQRWSRGLEMGFTLAGPASLGAVHRAEAWGIYEQVRGGTLDVPFRRLRELRHFDDQELNRLATTAETALQDLEAALRALGQGTP